MRKLLVFAALFAFSYDVVMDSFDSGCLTAPEPIHANVGDFHAVNPPILALKVDPVKTVRPPEETSWPGENLFDKSVFHPPKIPA